jgi:TolB protein
MFFYLLFLQTLCFSANYIAIGSAKVKKTTFNLSFPSSPQKSAFALPEKIQQDIQKTIRSDLLFYDDFVFQENAADMTLQIDKTTLENKMLFLTLQLINNTTKQKKWEKSYQASLASMKTLAHTIANDMVLSITGSPGVFLSKIAMCCEIQRATSPAKKEIFLTQFDGSQTQQITFDHSLALSPAWSPDGSRLTYSVYQGRKNGTKNIDLFELDLKTHKRRLLSNRKGINSGASYSPDGKKLALTMSYSGLPILHWLDLQTLLASRIPNTTAYDVDPCFSPDGKNLAFVSLRESSLSMIFSMKPSADWSSSIVERLTYAGRYNATPSWSVNNKIVFSGWIDRSFDIFIMNADGTQIERLTKNQGNNEDPYFSPDGRFIVFSSNRVEGKKNVFVMNTNGTFIKRLTYGMGNCVSPKWSSNISSP